MFYQCFVIVMKPATTVINNGY